MANLPVAGVDAEAKPQGVPVQYEVVLSEQEIEDLDALLIMHMCIDPTDKVRALVKAVGRAFQKKFVREDVG